MTCGTRTSPGKRTATTAPRRPRRELPGAAAGTEGRHPGSELANRSTADPAALIAAAAGTRVVQLGHVLRPGQPRNGTAPPYSHALTNGFGERIGSVPGQSPDICGVSDMISL